MAAVKRLTKEYQSVITEPETNITARPRRENDLLRWYATIAGPADTPYEGGIFHLNLQFSEQYPFRPPKVHFLTKIYHPNISPDGDICLDILQDKWSAALSVRTILLSICSLINQPNPDDPLVSEIANLYREDRDRYIEMARKWTREYAHE